MKHIFLKTLILSVLLLGACTTTPRRVDGLSEHTQRIYIQTRQYKDLLKAFDKEFASGRVKEKDYLLMKLNYATVLHYDGQYQRSNQVFKECQTLVDNYDSSLGEEALGFTLGENKKRFRLEDFEVLNISLMKSLNSLLAGDIEGATVEMRRMDRIGRMLAKASGQNLLEQTAYNTYLSGILWESQRKTEVQALDNAYIDYKRVQSVYPKHPYIRFDLWRTAFIGDFKQDLERWEKLYDIPEVYRSFVSQRSLEKKTGEVVIIFENGMAPMKDRHPEYSNIPVYIPRPEKNEYAKITLDGDDLGRTVPLADLEKLMIKDLENRYAGKVGVEKAKEIAGAILTVGLGPAGALFSQMASGFKSPPDTRAWDMLPANYQIARIPLPMGKYNLVVELPGSFERFEHEVQIIPEKKTFIFVSSQE